MCRLNHACVTCEHKKKKGGDGGGTKRDAKDKKACEWLQAQYPGVFRNKSGTEVSFINGIGFIRSSHPDLADALDNMQHAMEPTSMTLEDITLNH